MLIIPAIDLKDGRAVRLFKGEMESAKDYGAPLDFAKTFEKMGAKWLHIIDLNGAFKGSPQNLEQIKQIRESCGLKIQLGGGIRSEEDIRRYVSLGIERVILGSAAVKDPEFAKKMAQKYPIALGIDARGGFVSAEGWTETGEIRAVDFAAGFFGSKIEAIICTDIARDGTLEGVNLGFSEAICEVSGIETIVSGGFASYEDLDAIKASEVINGVIVGRAFYEGAIDLAEVLARFNASKS